MERLPRRPAERLGSETTSKAGVVEWHRLDRSGKRSVRQISDYCGGAVSSSTVGNVLRGGTLPDRLEVVDAIVFGCGGSPDDRADFAQAWRRLAMSQFDFESTRTDIPPGNGLARVTPPARVAAKVHARQSSSN
jgi:hypothetical protein